MKEIPFESEYALHILTQNHLKELFDLELVASEIQLNKLRLDNLAFDAENNSFVIIEYKNECDKNVLNQTQEYCELVRQNREYFLNRLENTDEVQFESTPIMIISSEFCKNQVNEAKPNVNLWKVTPFDDGTVTYENLKTGEVKTLNIDLKELELTEDRLLEGRSENMKEMYFNLKNRVLDEFDDVEIRYLVEDFSFRVDGNLICVIRFLKSSFNAAFYGKDLENAENTVDISSKSTGGTADYLLKYESDDDLDYFMDLFKQTYDQKRE